MLIFFFPSSPVSPPFVIHFGLIPLSSETILILYYFHFTGFMTSPYPHIISRGNFTPSRPSCFLLSFRVSPPFSLTPSLHFLSWFLCIAPTSLTFLFSLFLSNSLHPLHSIVLTRVKLLVSYCPAAGFPSIETDTKQKLAACLTHTQTPSHLNPYHNVCMRCTTCLPISPYSYGNKMTQVFIAIKVPLKK